MNKTSGKITENLKNTWKTVQNGLNMKFLHFLNRKCLSQFKIPLIFKAQ